LAGFKGVATPKLTPGSETKSRRKQKVEENRVTVQPKEDEDGDNFFSKHLATARFQRNHKLINQLFKGPDSDHDQNKAKNEKPDAGRAKRIKSLEEYKNKLDKDIIHMDELFKSRKTRLVEDGKSLHDKLEKFLRQSNLELTALRMAQKERREVRESLNNLLNSVSQDL